MRKYGWLFLLTISITACGPTHQNTALDATTVKDIHTLAVQTKSDSEFEVYLDRANATAGPAVMFGLIGAATASSYNSKRDQEKKERLLPRIQGMDQMLEVSNGLHEGLRQRQRFALVEPYDGHSAVDGILEMTIQAWGLINTDSRLESSLTPFVQIQCVLRRPGQKKPLMDVVETYFGNGSHIFQQYESDASLLRNALQSVLFKAGRQIGSRLVYSVGEENR